MTETELIKACLNNENAAQRTLYDRYKRAMYTLAYRLTNDFDDANDVLQDSFLVVFKDLAKFRQEATLGTWIRAIVVRKAYEKLKKPKFFELLEEIPDNSAIDWGSEIDAEQLENAIQALPDGFRTVFVMIEIEGYSHKEVAQFLEISEGTSKSQLFYAKRRLREMISRFKI